MKFSAEKLNMKGLTRRWVVNVLSVVFAVLAIFTVTASGVLYQYYFDTAEEYVEYQLETVQDSFAGFSAAGAAEFEKGAKEYVETFALHDKMEVQFLSSDGSVLYSTAGYIAETYTHSTDFSDAFTNGGGQALWQGKTSRGERVLSGVALILSTQTQGLCLGGVRVVISLSGLTRQYVMMVAGIAGITGLFFLLIVLSGLFFVNSIIAPIQTISKTAGQIAHGDFEARIETKRHRDDEIGMLCNTINSMAKELASTEQMKNEFISSVSHELRTPLTAIKGWGETVALGTDDPALVKKGMEVIVGEAQRLSVIVEDLLDFSRMQNGKLTYNMAPCDVVVEMAEAVVSLTQNAAKKQVLVDFTYPENIPVVMADGVRLQQVFVNLLDNALKYTPEGGSIVVDMKAQEDELQIMVSDTGCGIAPEDLDHIKQKFYKGKDAVRGSGIGLAIADEIVIAHGGSLDIASTLRVGTTVTVRLPLQGKSLTNENKEEHSHE